MEYVLYGQDTIGQMHRDVINMTCYYTDVNNQTEAYDIVHLKLLT